jgi:hypothetical protein
LYSSTKTSKAKIKTKARYLKRNKNFGERHGNPQHLGILGMLPKQVQDLKRTGSITTTKMGL